MNGQTPLDDVLDRQIDVARKLAALLESERSALTGQSPDAVAEIAACKVQLLEAFERLEQERIAAEPAAASPTASQASREASREASRLANDTSITRAASHRWKSLMSLMAACRQANETNGLIVSLRQGQIRQLMDIVRGVPALTYGPTGQTFASALRPLGRV